MSFGNYAAGVEMKGDELKFCPSCGCQFYAIRRAYGYGQASAYQISGKGQAQGIAKLDAEKKLSMVPVWHRCTLCGQYSSNDIYKIIQDFPQYRRRQFEKRIALLVGSALLLLFGVGLVCSIHNTPFDDSGGYVFIYVFSFLMLSFGIVCWKIGWEIKRDTPRNVDQNEINSRKRVEAWLRDWNKQSVKLIAPFLDQNTLQHQRNDAWKKLLKLQHKWDFRPHGRVTEYVPAILVAITAITLLLIAENDYARFKIFSSYCKKAKIAFSGKEYTKAIEFYNDALNVPGYRNENSANVFIQRAKLELERKSSFDKLMVSGKQALDSKKWADAAKAFNEAVKITGYENNSEACGYLKQCEKYVGPNETAPGNANNKTAMKTSESVKPKVAATLYKQEKIRADLVVEYDRNSPVWTVGDTVKLYNRGIGVNGRIVAITDSSVTILEQDAKEEILFADIDTPSRCRLDPVFRNQVIEQAVKKITAVLPEQPAVKQPAVKQPAVPPKKNKTTLEIEEYQNKIEQANSELKIIARKYTVVKAGYEAAYKQYNQERYSIRKTNSIDNTKAQKSNIDNKKKNYDALNAQMVKLNNEIKKYNLIINELKQKENN